MIDRTRPRRPGSLRRSARLLAVLSLIVTVAAIGLGAWGLVRLADARGDVVDRADPALLDVEALSARLVDQETSVRGFTVTADPAFLEPYITGLAEADARMESIDRIAEKDDNTELQAWVATIDRLAERWRIDYAEPTIAAVRAGTAGPSSELGKERFDAVRSTLDQGRATLTADRADARNRLDNSATMVTIVGIIAATGLVLLLLGIGIWTRRAVIDPMLNLGREVRTVTERRFDHEVHGSGPKELVELAEDVESMRRRIVAELVTVQALNRSLDERTEELERSNSDLEQFAYVASHDLQEPLRKVSSFCELLSKRYAGQLDERADQYIEFAVDGARRMSVLINDLLAFSRVGRTGVELVAVDTKPLLEQAIHNLGDGPEQAGARIEYDGLPTVQGDPTLLTTVFQNLVGNGIKFRGDESPVVRIDAEPDGDMWHFRFADNGIGIDPAYADKVFVIFQRLHAKNAYPGTGIGLALCRKIVEYHGGRIWLDPDITDGATFHLTLPRPTEESESSEAPVDTVDVSASPEGDS